MERATRSDARSDTQSRTFTAIFLKCGWICDGRDESLYRKVDRYDGDDGGNESHGGAAAGISRRAADKRLDEANIMSAAIEVDIKSKRSSVSKVSIVGC